MPAINQYSKSVLLFVFAFCMILSPSILHAAKTPKPPKFVNASPKLEPTPDCDILRLMKEKLGKPPKLDTKDLTAIKKGKVVVHKVGKFTEAGQLFEAFGTVDASPKELMAFMRDYPSRVGIMPHLEDATAKWEGNLAVVDLTIKVALTRLRYRLNVLHYGDYFMEWEYVHGDIKNTEGTYRFFPLSKGTRTLVVYRETSDPGIALPKFILNLLTKNSIPDVIKAMRKGMAQKKQDLQTKASE